MPYFITNINEVRLLVRNTLLESISNQYNKPYRFYMLCDKLCNIEGVEVKNQMIADASPISRKTFEKNCAYAKELFASESQMADDPSHGFYKSNVKGVPCLYMQYAGFEFIFLKDYKGGKEYWLDELKESQELSEDYPSHFSMEHFKSLKSFNQRIKYCQDNLKRIGGGSSRIVFKIDDQKVLKLAKNKKGIVQNDTEIDRGSNAYYSSILAQVFDSDDDGLWVEMELATPINKYEFYRLTNFDLKDVGNYLINFQSENNGRGKVVHQQKELVDRLVNDEFVQLLRDFVAGTDALAGDLGVATSYGLVKRNGHQELVIIDFGLTDRDYEKLYRESVINEDKNNINCPIISLTEEAINEIKKYKSSEEFLRAGGLSLAVLDRAAFGFSSEDIKELMPNQLYIKWKEDWKNVKWEQEKSGLSKKQYASKISLEEPIDVSFAKGKFFVEDGHHRLFAAAVLKKPLRVNLEIRDNPVVKLAPDLGYDEFHRCIFNQVKSTK
jgi:hypothetical protein